MATLIFDIETVGDDYDSFDAASQHILTRWIKEQSASDDEKYQHNLETLKNGLGFSPFTGSVVAVGLYDLERLRGAVYFQAPTINSPAEVQIDGFKYAVKTEPELLRSFWKICEKYDEFVTFNGRCFDVPFLMLRSAAHGIRPSKNLVAQRYLDRQFRGVRHVDLCDQLSFYGALPRRPSLHLVCRTFGIESSKTQGVTGDDVSRLYRTGNFEAIARYNARDVMATVEVYRRWRECLR